MPCAHWLLGGQHPAWHPGRSRSEEESCQCLSDGEHGVGFDHWHALLPGGGRRVFLNQPYAGRGDHYAQARRFADDWGLDAHPVAELFRPSDPLLSSSAVLFARVGVDVGDVVARLRGRWLELVPGATVPRLPEPFEAPIPPETRRTVSEVQDEASAADETHVVRSYD
ncbi:hypothetical protein [Microbacterium dextranolyticum]|uniref:hypothetical protein n=1 Tax=Microbacterium dextranolyticum TaxID=36806 RepID=UPI00195653A8|nr:hypothetical protein [Microbacterium dextranolyticum]MBM7463223.1 hypothetical protein [Microbacterium dextranolyticum]